MNNNSQRVYSPVEPERDRNHQSGYYKGNVHFSFTTRITQLLVALNTSINDSAKGRISITNTSLMTQVPNRLLHCDTSQISNLDLNPIIIFSGISEWSERQERQHQEHYAKERRSPLPYHRSPSPVIDNHRRFSPAPDYRHHQQSPVPDYLPRHSPVPDYRAHSPTPDYGRGIRRSPKRDVVTPTPPQRKRTNDRQRQRVVEERTR